MPSTISRTVARWALRALAGIAVLLVAVIAVVYALSERRFHRYFEVPRHTIAVANDSATIARGQHLVLTRGCQGCHGPSLEGHVELDNFLLGRLAGPNLTRGGRGATMTDDDWERAVRHGVRRDGTPLFIMPAMEHTGLSDADLAAIVAYARSLPASPNVPPKSRAGPVIRALFVAGVAPVVSAEEIDHARPHPDRVEVDSTPRYGAYLASMCVGCHGPGMSGGKIPGGPPDWKPAANLTPTGIGHYSEAKFVTALRTGRRPDGSTIDEQMPWKMLGQMNDTELKALYAYLKTLTPRTYGNH